MTSKIRIGVAGAIVVLALTASVAGARPAARDDLYRNPRLDFGAPATIALLPAVALADDPAAERAVERGWVALYAGTRARWMAADEVRARLARAGWDGEALTRVEEEVWRRGEVEPATASRLARLLGVDAVMSLRIERWEIADGGRATVRLSAALTADDGTRLWSISGLAGYGAAPSSAERNFNSDLSWIRRPALEPQVRGQRLGHALYALLSRWAWSLPEGPLYADGSAPVLFSQNWIE